MNRLAGGGLAITTLLTSIGLFGPEATEPEVRRVNDDDSLLSYWPSEEYNSDAPPECVFFNFSFIYTSELCSHFVTTRLSSTPYKAFQRAAKCAALHATECILGPEIGLSVPSAFLVHSTGEIRMILAPRIIPTSNKIEEKHVRIHHPSSRLLGNTRTLRFNSTIVVEYMDGRSRGVRKETLNGADSYCIQLLRLAFVPACWNALD
jgi:hypothetical protein